VSRSRDFLRAEASCGFSGSRSFQKSFAEAMVFLFVCAVPGWRRAVPERPCHWRFPWLRQWRQWRRAEVTGAGGTGRKLAFCWRSCTQGRHAGRNCGAGGERRRYSAFDPAVMSAMPQHSQRSPALQHRYETVQRALLFFCAAVPASGGGYAGAGSGVDSAETVAFKMAIDLRCAVHTSLMLVHEGRQSDVWRSLK
jgi:hypothetical protein